MNQRICDQFDAYLLGDLTEQDAIAFRRHVNTCEECCREMGIQNRVDAILAQDGRRVVPDALQTHFAASATQASRRRTVQSVAAAVTGSAAVAAMALIAIWSLLWPVEGSIDNADIASIPGSQSEQVVSQEPSRGKPVAVFESDDMIALPVTSASADVTIVRVYSTTNAVRRKRAEAALYALLDSNGG